MEDFDVLSAESFFLFSTMLKVMREGISSSISFALIMINLEVVIREFWA